MKSNWKFVGLCCSIVFEIFFWVSYLSLLLEKIGSPFADIIWLLSGALGIFFGIITIKTKANKALSAASIAMGTIQFSLWILAIFVTSM